MLSGFSSHYKIPIPTLRIFYTTDLHGSKDKFALTLKKAIKHNAQIVINGGDLLPKTNGKEIFKLQSNFLKYLEKYFKTYEKMKIFHLCFLGNDDLRIYDDQFDELCQRFEFVHNIAQRKVEIGGYEFIGMNWVVDYPFRVKDRCRKDTRNYQIGVQYGTALLSNNNNFDEISDWGFYINGLPTIEDELNKLPKPKNPEKTIYIIHIPPAGLGLDVCKDGRKVGSSAIYDFLSKKQPMMSLHGHIHESPEISGIWKANIGKTVCIQPGQVSIFTYVLIDLSRMEFRRFVK